MIVARVEIDHKETYGIIKSNFFYPIRQSAIQSSPQLRDVISLLRQDNASQSHVNSRLNSFFHEKGYPLTEITYLPPISDNSKILCIGINYPKLYNNIFTVKPKEIIIFSKFIETLVGHNEHLLSPIAPATTSFDYEGEIAVVIGKPGFKISEEASKDHIFGFSLFNDGSVRKWQEHSLHAGKNFYRSGSCGPYIVTKEEIKSFSELNFQTKLNGMVVQRAKLSEMFFNLGEIISYISKIIPLNVGDIIATGSPEGTGASQVPKRFLKKGDIIEIFSPSLGLLKNTVQ